MLFLMFLLGVYDQVTSQRVGSETYEPLTSESFVADSIKQKQLRSSGFGMNASKTLLQILLMSALSPTADGLVITLLVMAGGTILMASASCAQA
eukprot:s178_g47.t1